MIIVSFSVFSGLCCRFGRSVEIDIRFSVVGFCIVVTFGLCAFFFSVGMNERETRARKGYQRTALPSVLLVLTVLVSHVGPGFSLRKEERNRRGVRRVFGRYVDLIL